MRRSSLSLSLRISCRFSSQLSVLETDTSEASVSGIPSAAAHARQPGAMSHGGELASA